MIKNEDQYYTERLKMRKYGFELRTSWDHVDCLAEGFKEVATALYMNTRSAELAYNNNNITFNQYLEIIGLESVANGDKYKWERSETLPKIEPPTEPIEEQEVESITEE